MASSFTLHTDIDTYLKEGCGRCSLSGTPDCKALPWNPIFHRLRPVLLGAGLTESRKWGIPCYTWEGKNVVLFAALKDFCALSFLKGVLIPDPEGVLESPGPNSQSARYLRFQNLHDVEIRMPAILHAVESAIAAEKAGVKVDFRPISDWPVPEELQVFFSALPELEQAFRALTPGRQRGYLIHFDGAKQSATRSSRIEKAIPRILEGKGMMD